MKDLSKISKSKGEAKMLKIYVDTTANYKPWSGAVSTYETIKANFIAPLING